jgi:hypothetical protein
MVKIVTKVVRLFVYLDCNIFMMFVEQNSNKFGKILLEQLHYVILRVVLYRS